LTLASSFRGLKQPAGVVHPRRPLRVFHTPVFGAGLLAALVYMGPVRAADEKPTDPQAPGAPRCQEAIVNPVTGFAECVKPRGVPVDPPPERPPPSAEDCARHPDLDVPGCPKPK
jgi:hypothetical protein